MSSPQARFPQAESPIHGYFYSMVELGVLRFFIEYHIFEAIAESGISVSNLATETGVEAKLLERQANFLIAVGVLNSPSPGTIEHTPLSRKFQEPMATLFYPHLFDSFMGTAVKWPEYFKLNGTSEPQKSDQAPFGFAVGHPDRSFYEVLELMPERAKAFNSAMALTLDDMPVTGVYDFQWLGEKAANQKDTSARPSIVDIGGGKGQALKAILEANPSILPASCVLEDQEEVIRQANTEASGALKSVRRIGYSFFEEQPIKGTVLSMTREKVFCALVYYIRRVLNDWTDNECVQILSKVRAACAQDSRVLISENLLPDDPSIGSTALDLWMMNFGGKRRNGKMFDELASRARFRVSSIARDGPTTSGVVEMVPI